MDTKDPSSSSVGLLCCTANPSSASQIVIADPRMAALVPPRIVTPKSSLLPHTPVVQASGTMCSGVGDTRCDLEPEAASAILRMVDRRVGDRRNIAVTWVDGVPLTHETSASLPVDGAKSEKVRRYLEYYAEFPTDPAPALGPRHGEVARGGRASTVRADVRRTRAVKVWAKADDELAGVRVEIDTDPSDVPGVPWELLRNSDTDQAVALAAAEFIRTHHQTARAVCLPAATDEPLQVLLVICRPGAEEDVPFRSVTSRLVRSGADPLTGLDRQVLRPPRFARLAQLLRAAKAAGRPFHIVHFDGHGAFLDASLLDGEKIAVSGLKFDATGRRGDLKRSGRV